MKTIFIAVAHPDDESLVVGGTIAKYSQSGNIIHLLTATAGEAGSSGAYGSIPTVRLGETRQVELEKAATILGIQSMTQLRLPDGALKTVAAGDLEDRIYRQMIERCPDIVITFEPGGISNHPDHVRISQATTFAFQKYASSHEELFKNRDAKQSAIPEQMLYLANRFKRGQEVKLYYACIPESIGGYLKKKRVIPSESHGKPWSFIPDKSISCVIDISRFAKRKILALAAHQTQAEQLNKLTAIPHNPIFTEEFYYLRMLGTREVYIGKDDRVSTQL